MLFFAFGELGMSQQEFYDLDWDGDDGWNYRVWHYRLQLARKQEPFRDLQAQLHNMLAEQKDRMQPQQIMWLLTDRFAPRPAPKKAVEDNKAAWARMKAAGLL